MIKKYSSDIEESMKITFQPLNEKSKRIYAATKSEKLGFGCTKYISELLKIDPKAIRAGKKELEILDLLGNPKIFQKLDKDIWKNTYKY